MSPVAYSTCPSAQGLLLVRKSKRGLMLGVDKEEGFVIARLDAPDGGKQWSAPVFVRARSYSLGFTLGALAAWPAAVRRCWGHTQQQSTQHPWLFHRSATPQGTATRAYAWR